MKENGRIEREKERERVRERERDRQTDRQTERVTCSDNDTEESISTRALNESITQ